jgi:predicted PurR-regulated permease PerM
MSSKEKQSITTPKAWSIIIVVALVLGFLFLQPFLSLILLAVLLAFFTFPIYKKLLKKLKGREGLAAFFTTCALALILIVPTFIVFAVAATQALNLVNSLGISDIVNDPSSIESDFLDFVTDINSLIEETVGISGPINTDSLSSFVNSTLPTLISGVADSILSLAASIPAFFMNLIIFLFVYIGVLTNAKELLKVAGGLSPFDEEVTELYFKRIGLMANGMLRGQFLIALMQGLATSIALAIVGLDNYFFFFFIIFTFMSLIPLGAGIITIPMGIIAILLGYIWQGLVILGNHFIFVTNIDNIRPRFVPKEAQMQAALTILAAFSGVAMFGLLGVIYGPVIMIILVTTIETYLKVKAGATSKTS